MPKTTKQRTPPELHPQPPQRPSPRMETKKPTSPTRLWLLTGVLVQLRHAWARFRGVEQEPAPAEQPALRMTE